MWNQFYNDSNIGFDNIACFYTKRAVDFTVFFKTFLFPVVAGISYELIRFSSITSDNIFSRLLSYPNILMQKLTTAEPDNEMVEVAISAINESIRLDEANKIS